MEAAMKENEQVCQDGFFRDVLHKGLKQVSPLNFKFCIFKRLEKQSKELEDKQNTVNHLKKENRKARKMLAEYQLMMRTGASGMHKVSIGC